VAGGAHGWSLYARPMTDRSQDVAAIIDKSPLSGLQGAVIGLCACLVFLDGFDAQAIGYVAPVLIKAWHVPPGQMGPVFSAGLVGLMIGALAIAPLADRFGRRPVILLSTFAFGFFSLVTVGASSVTALLLLRFLTGIGLGGCMPNTISLTSEYAPHRRRSILVMLMFMGFTLGSLSAGLVSSQLISRYGWQAVFVVGGLLPLLAVPLVYFALPESICFLVSNHSNPKTISRLLNKIDRSIPVHESRTYLIEEQASGRVSVGLLFREGRARRTILLWIIFFMSLLDVYMLVNWLPTAMSTTGATMKTAIIIGTMLQVGGLFGALPLGWLLDRGGPRMAMMPAYLLAAVCIACVGIFAAESVSLTLLAVFGAGFGVIGGQTAANAVAASVYPTEVRSTGVGWALGIGRVGSIIGPAFAGVLITRHVAIHDIFFLAAIPALCAALAALGLSLDRTAVVLPKTADRAVT
jgi:AAHS family 4-hydroxybenzoate transporter-like MFS transporter